MLVGTLLLGYTYTRRYVLPSSLTLAQLAMVMLAGEDERKRLRFALAAKRHAAEVPGPGEL